MNDGPAAGGGRQGIETGDGIGDGGAVILRTRYARQGEDNGQNGEDGETPPLHGLLNTAGRKPRQSF